MVIPSNPDAVRSKLLDVQGLLSPWLKPTPLKPSPWGPWLKLETVQPTGAFKVRPAFHGILSQLDEARKRGVIASSSGNFAQAVAYAASKLGVDALIVMTSGTSPLKVERTRSWGAKVELCGNSFEERWATTDRLTRETGRLPLHPYDSEETILGDASLALELHQQLPPEMESGDVVVPSSGGGLLSGICLGMRALRPGWRVWGVQTEGNGSLARSLAAGKRVKTDKVATIADALVAATPGERTFSIVQRYAAGVLTVTDQQTLAAVLALWREAGQKVEPGGATSLAAWMSGKLPEIVSPEKTVLVCSGGNVAEEQLAEWDARG